MMPSWLSDIPISDSEQSIPLDSTPLSFARLILSLLGSTDPTVATATFKSCLTFGAPQIICRFSPIPISTSQRLSLSAFGCLEQLTTWPTTKPSNGGATGAI